MSARRWKVILLATISVLALRGLPVGATGTPRIVNGLPTHDFPTTGALLYAGGLPVDALSGTILKCR